MCVKSRVSSSLSCSILLLLLLFLSLPKCVSITFEQQMNWKFSRIMMCVSAQFKLNVSNVTRSSTQEQQQQQKKIKNHLSKLFGFSVKQIVSLSNYPSVYFDHTKPCHFKWYFSNEFTKIALVTTK